MFAAKFNVSSLSVLDLLRKDHKSLRGATPSSVVVGISSVGGVTLDELFAQKSAVDDVTHYCSAQQLDVLIVMTIYFPSFDGPPMRQIAVCGSHHKTKEIAEFLFNSEQLKLRTISHLCCQSCIAFDQRNITASRKVVLPLVKSFIEENAKLKRSGPFNFYKDGVEGGVGAAILSK